MSQPLLKSDDVWISALDAVYLVGADLGGDTAAKMAIAERLRDGALNAVADWWSFGADVGPLPYSIPSVSDKLIGPGYAYNAQDFSADKYDKLLREGLLCGSENWDHDFKRWRWNLGLFVFSHNGFKQPGSTRSSPRLDYPSRHVISGTEFRRSEILAIVGRAEAEPPPAAAETKITTRNQKKWHDGPVMAEFRQQIADRKIHDTFGPVDGFGVQAALAKTYSDRVYELFGDGPSIETAKRRATRLMDEWRRAYANRK